MVIVPPCFAEYSIYYYSLLSQGREDGGLPNKGPQSWWVLQTTVACQRGRSANRLVGFHPWLQSMRAARLPRSDSPVVSYFRAHKNFTRYPSVLHTSHYWGSIVVAADMYLREEIVVGAPASIVGPGNDLDGLTSSLYPHVQEGCSIWVLPYWRYYLSSSSPTSTYSVWHEGFLYPYVFAWVPCFLGNWSNDRGCGLPIQRNCFHGRHCAVRSSS